MDVYFLGGLLMLLQPLYKAHKPDVAMHTDSPSCLKGWSRRVA
jgi:hypothetical protein